MTDADKLVERLRSSAHAFREHNVYTQDGDAVRLTVQADEMGAAADLIERQAAEIERLREALVPFAEMAKWLDDASHRRDAIYCGGVPGLRCEVTQHDYHRARAALAGEAGRG
ncbi:MAG: hypothetical protein WDA25_01150 [Paracoccaceae bacterium]